MVHRKFCGRLPGIHRYCKGQYLQAFATPRGRTQTAPGQNPLAAQPEDKLSSKVRGARSPTPSANAQSSIGKSDSRHAFEERSPALQEPTRARASKCRNGVRLQREQAAARSWIVMTPAFPPPCIKIGTESVSLFT
jgi:hypothetical protein